MLTEADSVWLKNSTNLTGGKTKRCTLQLFQNMHYNMFYRKRKGSEGQRRQYIKTCRIKCKTNKIKGIKSGDKENK